MHSHHALFVTTAGYGTITEAENPDKYSHVEDKIDELNKTVNIDLALFVAQVKRSVYGDAGFEIVLDDEEYPPRLLSLQSTLIRPDIDEDWTHTGYTYKGKKGFYTPTRCSTSPTSSWRPTCWASATWSPSAAYARHGTRSSGRTSPRSPAASGHHTSYSRPTPAGYR